MYTVRMMWEAVDEQVQGTGEAERNGVGGLGAFSVENEPFVLLMR